VLIPQRTGLIAAMMERLRHRPCFRRRERQLAIGQRHGGQGEGEQ